VAHERPVNSLAGFFFNFTTPLSETSIGLRGETVDYPDFTRVGGCTGKITLPGMISFCAGGFN
jgi:hypothetical protein